MNRIPPGIANRPSVDSAPRRVNRCRRAKTLATRFSLVLESAIHRATDRREEFCPDVRAWRRSTPVVQDAPSYPHLWITLCVSEGDSRVGRPLGSTHRIPGSYAPHADPRQLDPPVSTPCGRRGPPPNRGAEQVLARLARPELSRRAPSSRARGAGRSSAHHARRG